MTAQPFRDDAEPTPSGPDDLESSLVVRPWHRSEPSEDGRLVKIVQVTGLSPLERVDVDEDPDRVTITLYERHPPAFDRDGTPTGTAAVSVTRCVAVPLAAALANRPVYDGATGRRPAEIEPGNHDRAHALEIDIDTFPCVPMPSGS